MNQNQLPLSVHSSPHHRKGERVEIEITDLADNGDGVGRFGRLVVFVPDTTPRDRVIVELVQVKPTFANGKLHQILEPSEHRIRPRCIVADKCGGCQWQHIDYKYQLQAKENQIIQALERIGGLNECPVSPILANPKHKDLGYRNKATYPLGLSKTLQVQGGYYQKGSHRIINLNQCPVQDKRLNPLLEEVKLDLQYQNWPVYDEKKHSGELRHLSLRIGRRTGEMLLTLVVKTGKLPELENQAQEWLERYPQLVGVCLNYNPEKTNRIFGEKTRCIAGQPFVREHFAGLEFQLKPDTFFQVNTEVAEALLEMILDELQLKGSEVLLDAYCGIGTFTLPFAKRVKSAIGVEMQQTAVEQAGLNAALNGLMNVTFHAGKVENILPQLDVQPDIVLLDPPRKGCDRAVLETLVKLQPERIVYVSCKPTTLARDLKLLCEMGGYQLTRVQPADFFPQTSHVECVAFLSLPH
ncbi:MAG: hypothetical protein RLZZ338_1634 [Cyanobacteriota bacterium]|jgi:23S rRNA (uracil1939-C5)-methyltransferase